MCCHILQHEVEVQIYHILLERTVYVVKTTSHDQRCCHQTDDASLAQFYFNTLWHALFRDRDGGHCDARQDYVVNVIIFNGSSPQIPQCLSQISINAQFCSRDMNISVNKWWNGDHCILEFVQQVYSSFEVPLISRLWVAMDQMCWYDVIIGPVASWSPSPARQHTRQLMSPNTQPWLIP